MTDTNKIVACPACTTLNRVPLARIGAGAKCGRCHKGLFAGRPIELTTGTIGAHAARSDLPLVVDFWASWCGPCRQMAPAFEAAAAELEPSMRLAKVNTEAEPLLAERFAIRSIPTMLVLLHGRELARTSGAMPTGSIVAWARQVAAR